VSSLRGIKRSLSVRKKAFVRCCRDGVPHCKGCCIEINARTGIIYEHVMSAGLGGEPTLDNAKVPHGQGRSRAQGASRLEEEGPPDARLARKRHQTQDGRNGGAAMKLSRRMQRMNRKQRKGLNWTLAQAEREFTDKFGRAPTDGDPVFFDPNGDTPKPLDIEDFDRHLIDAMIKARHPWPFDPRLSKKLAGSSRRTT
jgi:hypothetical protein